MLCTFYQFLTYLLMFCRWFRYYTYNITEFIEGSIYVHYHVHWDSSAQNDRATETVNGRRECHNLLLLLVA